MVNTPPSNRGREVVLVPPTTPSKDKVFPFFTTNVLYVLYLFRVQTAADGASLLGAKVEGHVLHVLVVLAELPRKRTAANRAFTATGGRGHEIVGTESVPASPGH